MLVLTRQPLNLERAQKQNKITKSIKITHDNSSQKLKFNNPLLQIEYKLRQQIENPASDYNLSIESKREILLDTIEEIRDLDLGFSQSFDIFLSKWRNINPRSKYIQRQVHNSSVRKSRENIDSINALKIITINQIDELEERISELNNNISSKMTEIKLMKQKIFGQSIQFEEMRQIQLSLNKLQGKVQSLLSPIVDPEYDRVKKENIQLEAEIRTLSFELELVQQMNRRQKLALQGAST